MSDLDVSLSRYSSGLAATQSYRTELLAAPFALPTLLAAALRRCWSPRGCSPRDEPHCPQLQRRLLSARPGRQVHAVRRDRAALPLIPLSAGVGGRGLGRPRARGQWMAQGSSRSNDGAEQRGQAQCLTRAAACCWSRRRGTSSRPRRATRAAPTLDAVGARAAVGRGAAGAGGTLRGARRPGLQG